MKKVVIVGAGISGLFIANLFKKNSNLQVTIYEKDDVIEKNKGYGIQLSVNSVKYLNEIGFDDYAKHEKFYPKRIDFYSKDKIKLCDLEISKFNLENCKYTTMKRSVLINFLKKGVEENIKTGINISKIDYIESKIKLTFGNEEKTECDYLILADGVFSKSKSLLLNSQVKPKYNNTIAIRGMLNKFPKYIEENNISLFLNSNFHHLIYPINLKKDFNYVAIMEYKLSIDEQNDYSLFSKNTFLEKILKKIPKDAQEIIENLEEIKIFPIFVSKDFYKIKNKNIHLIGDAFFAFPPSFAQGASQSIEGAYELFKDIKNNTEKNFFDKRVNTSKIINNRSKFNQFAFHLSNPIIVFFRNFFLKKLVKNDKFLENYLGKVYR